VGTMSEAPFPTQKQPIPECFYTVGLRDNRRGSRAGVVTRQGAAMKQLPKADIKGKYRQAIYLYIASTEQV